MSIHVGHICLFTFGFYYYSMVCIGGDGMGIKTLGQKIKELRNAIDISQTTLANALDINVKSIQRYERNKNMPDAFSLVRIASFFDVSSDYLLGLAGIKSDMDEEKYKILEGKGKNKLYIHYLFCKNNVSICEESTYFWIFSNEREMVGGQTEWIGWHDDSHKIEIRRLRPVDPLNAMKMCTKAYGRPMLVNEELDARVFSVFGGHAIIKEDVCAAYLPEFMKNFIVSND